MPSTSAKQHRFMEAVAHNSAFAKKAGVPQSVGKDFSAADKGKKFAGGGAATQKINRQDTQHGAMDMPFKSLKKFTGMKSGGDVDTKKPNPFMEMIAEKKEKAEGESPSFQKKEGKKGEKAEMKFAKGGMAKGGMHKMPDGKMMKNSAMNMGGMAKYAKGGGIESKGKTVGRVIKMASGGSVSSRADGIASRGKTNCKIY